MRINKIVDYINRSYIASDYVREPDIYYFMDLVIDDINERLQAKFPTFTDWPDFVDKWNSQITDPRFMRDRTVYDAFPDEYIRSVVALGAALKYYTRDEEGEMIALDYQNRYEGALFKMTRDYLNQVPWWFQDNTGGFVPFTYVHEMGPWDLNPRGVVMRGNNTKGL